MPIRIAVIIAAHCNTDGIRIDHSQSITIDLPGNRTARFIGSLIFPSDQGKDLPESAGTACRDRIHDSTPGNVWREEYELPVLSHESTQLCFGQWPPPRGYTLHHVHTEGIFSLCILQCTAQFQNLVLFSGPHLIQIIQNTTAFIIASLIEAQIRKADIAVQECGNLVLQRRN